ncbi:hypothetical protein SNAG_1594 [Streptococcus sp. NPS 308]|nr:hypothetical protein SNAG_1594 [Streptococcus sp. NPS 308]
MKEVFRIIDHYKYDQSSFLFSLINSKLDDLK